ncbi:MAG TPA: hypothetical protein VFQ80_10695, partial [Thermomicrobiales bacterium]|nr:hypothetical protein [Thermomicrobiales bacterium]
GQPEYLYIAMALGVAVIFAGYLETRRPDAARSIGLPLGASIAARAGANGAQATPDRAPASPAEPRTGQRPRLEADGGDPAVAFIEATFLTLPAAACAARCVAWSVPVPPAEPFDRETARAVWGLRRRLSDHGRRRFDALPGSTQAQLAELYDDVLLPPRPQRRAPKRPRPTARLSRRG